MFRLKLPNKQKKVVKKPSLGLFLQKELQKPFSASVNYFMRLVGRDYQIWDGNLCIAFTYLDQFGDQGIVVLNGDYDGKAYQLAKLFELSNPAAGKISVHFVNR